MDIIIKKFEYLNDSSFISENREKIKRVVDVAVPFLNLYGPTRTVTAVGMGTIRSALMIRDVWNGEYEKIGPLALTVSSVGLMLFRPRAAVFLTLVAQLATHKNRLELAQTLVSLISFKYSVKEIAALSLILQVGIDLYEAREEFKKDRWLETAANVLLAGIRTYQLMPQLEAIHKSWTTKELTQADLDRIAAKMDRVRKGEHHYRLWEHEHKNVAFRNCNFKASDLNHQTFRNVLIENCNFEDAQIMHSLFADSTIYNSNFKGAALCGTEFRNVEIFKSDFTGAAFNEAVINKTIFRVCKFAESCFLWAKVSESRLEDSDLTDCLLFGSKQSFVISGGKPHRITRPVVALGWHHESPRAFAGKVERALKQDFNVIICKFDDAPLGLDPQKLDSEVYGLLKTIRADNIPQTLLQKGGEQIQKAMAFARELVSGINGLILPGGADIEPELYGAKRESAYTHEDTRRSIMEFALLSEAIGKKLPVWGICRGCQMINVFHGGTLNQNIGSYPDELPIRVDGTSAAAEKMREIIGADRLSGYSAHHQANDKIGKGLTSVMSQTGISKAVLNDEGTIIGTQFHPEVYPELNDPDQLNMGIYYMNEILDHPAFIQSALEDTREELLWLEQHRPNETRLIERNRRLATEDGIRRAIERKRDLLTERRDLGGENDPMVQRNKRIFDHFVTLATLKERL